MNPFKAISATLDEAVSQGLITVRDISGCGSWKGMDISLESQTWVRGVDVLIPEGTIFREQAGRYQQMMTTGPSNVYVPARKSVTRRLDDTICTQPRAQPSPPKSTPISEEMRRIATMSDYDFEQRLDFGLRRGLVDEANASKLREARQALLKDGPMMEAIRQGSSERRIDYSYTTLSLASLSALEVADAFLGMAVNEYRYGDKDVAVTMLGKAANSAPKDARKYYDKVFKFACDFKDKKEVELILMLSCGSKEEREKAELLIDLGRRAEPPFRPFQPTRERIPYGAGGAIQVDAARLRADGSFSQDIYRWPNIGRINYYAHIVRGVNQDGENFEYEKHPAQEGKWVDRG